MKKTILYFAILIATASCQTVLEDVPVPEISQKAVVFGTVHLDTNYHTLRITKSRPILNNSEGSDHETIPDAQVTVSSGGRQYNYTYNAVEAVYVYRGTIASSDSITLRVVTPTLGTLTSKVAVPSPIGTYTLGLDSVVREFETEYDVLFTLPARSTSQYFRLEGFTAYATDTFGAFSTAEYHSNEDDLNSDIKVRSTFYKWKDNNGAGEQLYVSLSSISEEYYRYGIALRNYQPGNPFAEPVQLPSNVSGGLGIFAVSRSVVVEVD